MRITEEMLKSMIASREAVLTKLRSERNEIDDEVYYNCKGYWTGYIDALQMINDLMNIEQ